MLSNDLFYDKRCLFCHSNLKADYRSIYDHYTCPKKCMKVMYDEDEYWVLIRVYNIHGLNLVVDKREGEFIIVELSDTNAKTNMKIPLFDIFKLNLTELRHKIKTYITFS